MNWNATQYFSSLTTRNRLAVQHGFRFCRVASLDGFEEALQTMQNTLNIVAVSEAEQGYTELLNAPHTRRVKTVFIAMRHAIDDMQERQERIEIINELFRQFCTDLIRERTHLEQEGIYLDTRIRLNEIERYFFSGCACCYFQIAVDIPTDLRYNPDEWT